MVDASVYYGIEALQNELSEREKNNNNNLNEKCIIKIMQQLTVSRRLENIAKSFSQEALDR